MALKRHYVIDGRIWLPLSRAAALLGTNVAGIKRLISSGALDCCQLRSGSTTLLVDQAAVLARRRADGVAARQRKRYSDAAIHTARQRGRSMLDVPPDACRRRSDAFVRTWDPSPMTLPVSGRNTPSGRPDG